jgi:hypothetical protein
MDYKRFMCLCSGLTLICSIILLGCNKLCTVDDPIRTEESFLQEFRKYLAERGRPNLLLVQLKKAEVYCKDSKFIETLGIYEICHSLDDRIHPGDLLMRRSHYEGSEQQLYNLDLWVDRSPCSGGGASLDFFPLQDDDIEFIKEERLVPNDPNTKRRLYYVRDLVPMTLSNLYPIVSSQMTNNQKASFTNAIKAYFVTRDEYRRRKPSVMPR